MRQYIIEVWNLKYNHLHSQHLLWAESESDALHKAPMLFMPHAAEPGEYEFHAALPEQPLETKA